MVKITVVIPVAPDKPVLALESLKKQEQKVEVVIEAGTNTSENRNKGAKKSKGKIIAFANAHTILPKDWSKKIIEFFEKYPEIDIVGGPQLTPKEDSYFGRVSGYALSSIFGSAEASARYKINRIDLNANEKYLTSSNLACRKNVFEKVKFDKSIYPGEDPKFISDSKKAGFNVAYSPEIINYNKRRSNVNDFAKQIFNYGQMRPRKEDILETMKNPSFLIPSLFTIYIIFFGLLSLISWIFVIPLILYFILSLLFSVLESLKNREILSIFILPFLFFTIHISYGLGFIWGMIKKWNTRTILFH